MKAILIGGSILISLVVVELGLRLIAPQPLNGVWYTYSEHRGIRVNRSSGSARQVILGRDVTVSFSHPHLRGPGIRGAQNRVLVLGESFTYGWLIREDDTYVRLLEKTAQNTFGPNAFEFLNASHPGWGASDYVAYVDEFGDEVKPHVIVVFVNGDDIGRAMASPLYQLENSGLTNLRAYSIPRNRTKQRIQSWPCYLWAVENLHIVQPFRRMFHVIPPKITQEPDVQSQVALGKALFRHLDSWCKSRGVRLIVLTTGLQRPPFKDVLHEGTLRFLDEAPAFFEGLNVPFKDIEDGLKSRCPKPESLLLPNDPHPNEEGARQIAEVAAPWLMERLRADRK
jgi:hypothetical protein